MSELVKVMNRCRGLVNYTIPEANGGFTRSYQPGETKKIPLEELEKLQWIPGGDFILRNYLVINDKSALDALNMEDLEPEYFYTEMEVKELLANGSLDQLEDALNFAPEGVIDMIKKFAVDTQVPDTRKRDLIYKKTGVNIQTAIDINKMMSDDNKDNVPETEVKRKAAPVKLEPSTPVRKAASVKVVNKAE